jgi:hypothetical protein
LKLRVWKSLTFIIGLILFIAAFGVILVAGSIFNPPPYRIVIALEDIAPYTVLTREMLAVDEQTMHQRVAARLVHEEEIDSYVGGLVIETVHAGEPLRRNGVVAAGNPAAVHRLSLALGDPDLVAAVVPVNPKVIPDNVTAGDYVNVTMGVEGSVSQLATAARAGAAGPDTWSASPAGFLAPTPTPFTATLPITPTGPLPLSEEVPEVAPPLDKIVLPQVQVLNVTREKVPNPNYGMTFGQEGAQEPPFLEGDIESITVLVPQAAEELLYFAVDNGTLHISVVPHAAVLEGASPSTGVLWEDIVRFFQEERLRAIGAITATSAQVQAGPVATAPPVSPTTPITAEAASGTPAPVLAPPTPAPLGTEATSPTPLPPGPAPSETPGQAVLPSGWRASACIGGGLVIGLGAAGFALMRRRKGRGR